MSFLKILKLDRNNKLEEVEVKNDLSVFQELVGGIIEVIPIGAKKDVFLIVNQEGKINGMPFNFSLYETKKIGGAYFDPKIVDIYGNVFFVSNEEEDFDSLGNDQIKGIKASFNPAVRRLVSY